MKLLRATWHFPRRSRTTESWVSWSRDRGSFWTSPSSRLLIGSSIFWKLHASLGGSRDAAASHAPSTEVRRRKLLTIARAPTFRAGRPPCKHVAQQRGGRWLCHGLRVRPVTFVEQGSPGSVSLRRTLALLGSGVRSTYESALSDVCAAWLLSFLQKYPQGTSQPSSPLTEKRWEKCVRFVVSQAHRSLSRVSSP